MSMNPNLNGELRVTVVATGLHGHKVVQTAAPTMQIPVNPKVTAFAPRAAEPVMPNLTPRHYEIPAIDRVGQGQRRMAAGGGGFPQIDEDIINIPAFLRNQAD